MISLPEYIHTSWSKVPAFNLLPKIRSQLKGNISPNSKKIFKAFTIPLDSVRLIILGMDPYPNPKDACGVAFAVEEKRMFKDYPFSLQVLMDALANEYQDESIYDKFDPTLQYWMNQGVLLINCSLSCKVGVSGSHQQIWREFTTELVKYLVQKDIYTWWLLGKQAQDYTKYLNNQVVFKSIHPAALAYSSNVQFDSKFKLIQQHFLKNFSTKIKFDYDN